MWEEALPLETRMGACQQIIDRQAVVIAAAPAPAAAADAMPGPHLVAWRHGYRTGIVQTIEQLRRLDGSPDAPRIELEDAIRLLEAWRTDLG